MIDIYNMELHERRNVKADLYVTRVAGGWIYSHIFNKNVTSDFIRYDNEFQDLTKFKGKLK